MPSSLGASVLVFLSFQFSSISMAAMTCTQVSTNVTECSGEVDPGQTITVGNVTYGAGSSSSSDDRSSSRSHGSSSDERDASASENHEDSEDAEEESEPRERKRPRVTVKTDRRGTTVTTRNGNTEVQVGPRGTTVCTDRRNVKVCSGPRGTRTCYRNDRTVSCH